jgi:hypothetical protein
MKPCPLCGTRALPRADGTCPACNGEGKPKEAPQVEAPKSSPFPMIGPVIGVTIAAIWTNRTPSGGFDMMTLVVTVSTLLGGILGVLTLRAVHARMKR